MNEKFLNNDEEDDTIDFDDKTKPTKYAKLTIKKDDDEDNY